MPDPNSIPRGSYPNEHTLTIFKKQQFFMTDISDKNYVQNYNS